jgi:predicted CopG family antitoxin
MPKVITISDEVYEKLSKLKKGRSFSKTIDELIEFY